MNFREFYAALAGDPVGVAVLPGGDSRVLGDPIVQEGVVVFSAFGFDVQDATPRHIAQLLMNLDMEGVDLPVRVWCDGAFYRVARVSDGDLFLRAEDSN